MKKILSKTSSDCILLNSCYPALILVRWLKANFFMDVDVRDKSTIFGPDDDYDVYFKFWMGTTSGDLNMAAV